MNTINEKARPIHNEDEWVFLKFNLGASLWLHGKEALCQCQRWVRFLVQGHSTCCGATKPVRHSTSALVPQLQKPTRPRAHALREEKPLWWEASVCTARAGSPCSLQLGNVEVCGLHENADGAWTTQLCVCAVLGIGSPQWRYQPGLFPGASQLGLQMLPPHWVLTWSSLWAGSSPGLRVSRLPLLRRWLDGVADSMDRNSSQLQEIVEDREAWHAAVYGVTGLDTT